MSAIRRTWCFFPCRPASSFSALSTTASLFREMSAMRITSSISESIGTLSSMVGLSMPSFFTFSNCSRRELAICAAPPSAKARMVAGSPLAPLTTPARSIPFAPQRSAK